MQTQFSQNNNKFKNAKDSQLKTADGTFPLAPQPALDACRVEDAAAAGEGLELLVLKRGVKADRALLDNDHVLTAPAAPAAPTPSAAPARKQHWRLSRTTGAAP